MPVYSRANFTVSNISDVLYLVGHVQWKDGARNTTGGDSGGRRVGHENMLLKHGSAKRRNNRYHLLHWSCIKSVQDDYLGVLVTFAYVVKGMLFHVSYLYLVEISGA